MPEQDALFEDPPPDLRQQIAELERELTMRRQVYPRLIEKGSLTQEQATYRIRCLEETISRLRSAGDLYDALYRLVHDGQCHDWHDAFRPMVEQANEALERWPDA